MTLVDCRVGAEEVKVAAAVDVPHVHALALVQDHRHRRVVVCAVPLLPVNVLRTADHTFVRASVGQFTWALMAQRLPALSCVLARGTGAVLKGVSYLVEGSVEPECQWGGDCGTGVP